MSNSSQACPGYQVLSEYFHGGLSLDQMEQVDQHIDHCPSCQTQLEEIDDNPGPGDFLVKNLKNLALDQNDEIEICLQDVDPFVIDESLQTQRQQTAGCRFAAKEGYGLIRYTLISECLAGHCCQVFVARSEFDETVMIKLPRPGRLTSPFHQRQFNRDALAWQGLTHPRVMPVREVGCWYEHVPFVCLPIAIGPSLAEWMRGDRQFPAQAVRSTIHQIALALDHAHQADPPVLHRHLHPGNVFVSRQGRVEVADFGLVFDARYQVDLLESHSLQNDFFAPEVRRLSRSRVSVQSDIYSLGALLSAMLERCPELETTTGDGYRHLARRCQNDLAYRRPASVAEFLRILAALP